MHNFFFPFLHKLLSGIRILYAGTVRTNLLYDKRKLTHLTTINSPEGYTEGILFNFIIALNLKVFCLNRSLEEKHAYGGSFPF